MTYDEIEAEVRKLAHSLPPSDFGSTRAIQAVAQYVYDKLSNEVDAAFCRGQLSTLPD